MSADIVTRQRIHDLLVDLFVAVDEKDWSRARGYFADTVAFDMTSLAGGEPEVVEADSIVEGWQGGLTPVRHVHHQVGNFRFEVGAEAAIVQCYGIAYHYNETDEGPTITTFVGAYDFTLRPSDGTWRVDGLRFNKKFVETRPAFG